MGVLIRLHSERCTILAICFVSLDDDALFSVKNVYTLTDAVVDWNGLGIQLGVNPARLKKIGRENKTEDESRSDMIRIWMNSDPQASWVKLSEALEKVDHRVLANKIHSQVLPAIQLKSGPQLLPGMLQ